MKRIREAKMDENISVNNKMISSIKWSGLAEVLAKLIQPISNMILARLLTPGVFGVVATINIVISFADMFTDAGFQKYIIQHEFRDKSSLRDALDVAFWSNLFLSVIIWFAIYLFRNPLARLVGSPELGNVLAIACVILPLTSFSSLQSAYQKRIFNFRLIFKARVVTTLVPILITVPLAFILRTYWALIIGTIFVNLINALILTLYSDWKPRLFYSITLLNEMLSFSSWTLLEQFFIWLTSYIGTFIVGHYLTSYYLGIYKTSMTTVNQIMHLITSSTLPVLFAGLSRLQNDKEAFIGTFLIFQKMIALLVLPMSAGIYVYKELVTSILLGSQWMEAVNFVGLWALMSGLTIVFGYYSSEVYRALGKPKLSVLSQGLHLLVLIPLLIWSAQRGYKTLYICRSLVRIQAILVDLVILWIVVRISPLKMIASIRRYLVATIGMTGIALYFKRENNSLQWSFISIIICIIFYFGILYLFKEERIMMKKIVKMIRRKENE